MGNILTVWSQNKKSGKTLLLYNLIKSISRKIPEKSILVLCINMNFGNLLPLFAVDADNTLMLEKAVNYNIAEPNEILEYKKFLANTKNIYFMGSQNTTENYAAHNIEIYEKLIFELKDTFDLVLVDAGSGINNQLTNMVISYSDYILNVISQDIEMLDHGFANDKDIAYAVNYYKEIFPRSADIRSKYSLNAPIFKFPICNILQELKNKDMLNVYEQHDTEYNQNINKMATYILKTLKYPVKEEQEKDSKTQRPQINRLFSKLHRKTNTNKQIQDKPGESNILRKRRFIK